MKLFFEVVSELYRAGRTEDGAEYLAEVYLVQAENERGDRWIHPTRFKGCRVERVEDFEESEENGYQSFGFFTAFVDVREDAKARAERLVERINAADGAVDLDLWSETSPAYGSAAYSAYGQFDDWYREQVEDGRIAA